jgi:hypothetical protein
MNATNTMFKITIKSQTRRHPDAGSKTGTFAATFLENLYTLDYSSFILNLLFSVRLFICFFW